MTRNENPKEEPVQHVCCYKTVTKDGKILRSSSTFIRNDQEEIIGCFCINYDITEFLQCNRMLEEFTAFSLVILEKLAEKKSSLQIM